MKSRIDQKWNHDLATHIKSLAPVRKWLKKWIDDMDTDWESQKSAHQALKLLEMTEFEMWNMQWWKNKKEQSLYLKAEKKVNGK